MINRKFSLSSKIYLGVILVLYSCSNIGQDDTVTLEPISIDSNHVSSADLDVISTSDTETSDSEIGLDLFSDTLTIGNYQLAIRQVDTSVTVNEKRFVEPPSEKVVLDSCLNPIRLGDTLVFTYLNGDSLMLMDKNYDDEQENYMEYVSYTFEGVTHDYWQVHTLAFEYWFTVYINKNERDSNTYRSRCVFTF